MVNYCSAAGCLNRSTKDMKESGITFHRFPLDPALRQKWIDALNRKDFIPSKHAVVCSAHFHKEDIDRSFRFTVRLRAGAVPFIFATYNSCQDKLKKSKKIPKISSSSKDIMTSPCLKIFLVSASDSTDEKSEILCDHCKRASKQVNAKGFCVDCDEYLCITCYNYHKKDCGLKHHVLQDQNNMPNPGKKPKLTDICVDKCFLHTDKVVEYFCHQCQQLLCSFCIARSHRTCEEIKYIPNIAHMSNSDEEFWKVKSSITEISKDLEVVKNTIHSNLANIKTFEQNAKASFRKQRDEINQLFDELEKHIDTEVETIKTKDEETLSSALTHNNTLIWDLYTMKNDIESKKQSGKLCQLYVAMKKAEHEVVKMKKVVNGFKEQTKINSYEYQPSENVTDFMKNLREIGTIMKKKVCAFVKELNMLAISDKKKCDISDLCLLSENQLVGLDKANEAIKVINIDQNSIISVLEINTVPCCVTKIKDNQLAVTLPWQMQIQCFSMSTSGSLSAEQLIKVGGNCCGIACYDRNLIVSYEKATNVQIIDMTGKVLREITLDDMGQQLFANPGYLAFCPANRSIYVSDIGKKSVTMMTVEGKVKLVYRATNLVKPSALIVSKDKSVFVCDCVSDNIHMLSPDVAKGQVVLDQSYGIFTPQCVTLCNRNNYLFVGMENQNDIKVYQIG